MEGFIIAVIVALAAFFTVRRFFNLYRKQDAPCCGGCSCDSKKSCAQDVSFLNKN